MPGSAQLASMTDDHDEATMALSVRLLFLIQNWLVQKWKEKRKTLKSSSNGLELEMDSYFHTGNASTKNRSPTMIMHCYLSKHVNGLKTQSMKTGESVLDTSKHDLWLQENIQMICIKQLKSEIFYEWRDFVGINVTASYFHSHKLLRNGLNGFTEFVIRKMYLRRFFKKLSRPFVKTNSAYSSSVLNKLDFQFVKYSFCRLRSRTSYHRKFKIILSKRQRKLLSSHYSDWKELFQQIKLKCHTFYHSKTMSRLFILWKGFVPFNQSQTRLKALVLEYEPSKRMADGYRRLRKSCEQIRRSRYNLQQSSNYFLIKYFHKWRFRDSFRKLSSIHKRIHQSGSHYIYKYFQKWIFEKCLATQSSIHFRLHQSSNHYFRKCFQKWKRFILMLCYQRESNYYLRLEKHGSSNYCSKVQVFETDRLNYFRRRSSCMHELIRICIRKWRRFAARIRIQKLKFTMVSGERSSLIKNAVLLEGSIVVNSSYIPPAQSSVSEKRVVIVESNNTVTEFSNISDDEEESVDSGVSSVSTRTRNELAEANLFSLQRSVYKWLKYAKVRSGKESSKSAVKLTQLLSWMDSREHSDRKLLNKELRKRSQKVVQRALDRWKRYCSIQTKSVGKLYTSRTPNMTKITSIWLQTPRVIKQTPNYQVNSAVSRTYPAVLESGSGYMLTFLDFVSTQ